MIKVTCESCKASYELDPRRIPPGGMKMRCPRCGTSFSVTASADLAGLKDPSDIGEKPRVGNLPRSKGTIIGQPITVPPPLPQTAQDKVLKGTVFGLGAAAKKDPPKVGLKSLEREEKSVEAPIPVTGGTPEWLEKAQVDLPAVKKTSSTSDAEDLALADLPALSLRPPTAASTTVELPALKSTPAASDEKVPDFTDLLEPINPSQRTGFGDASSTGSNDLPVVKPEADLPVVLRSGRGTPHKNERRDSSDLPKAKGTTTSRVEQGRTELLGGGFGELELPILKSAERRESARETPLPDAGELPIISNLPPSLPVPTRQKTNAPELNSDPPSLKIGEARTLIGSPVKTEASLPPSRLSELGIADFVDPGEDFSQTANATRLSIPQSSVGEELDIGDSADRPASAASDEIVNRVGGETLTYGEVDLAVGERRTSEMEFGISQTPLELSEEPAVIGLPPEILRRRRGEEFEAKQQAQNKKSLALAVKIGALIVALALAGLGAGLTDYGIFWIYLFEQYLPAAGTPAFANTTIKEAERLSLSDTYGDVRRSLKTLAAARAKTGLNRAILAASVLHEALYLTRFGRDSASGGRIATIITRLEERGGKAPGMALANAAYALQRGDLDRAEKHLNEARQAEQTNAYLELVAGELFLRRGRFQDAQKAFENAFTQGGGARAQWGAARAAIKRANAQEVAELIEKTLALSPLHADALVAKAALLIKGEQYSNAKKTLRQAAGVESINGQYLWTSKDTKSEAFTTLGYADEVHGRLSSANHYYDLALDADPFRPDALLGSGRVSLREHRANDALARFEAALGLSKSNPGLVLTGRPANAEAELGVSQTLLSLGKIRDGLNRLERLEKVYPKDGEVALSLGKALLASGDVDGAQRKYRKSIELSPERFEAYLALAQLLFKQDKASEATAILADATRNVPESAEMRRMLGQSELSRNRLDNALHEFRRALELDSDDWEARFGLGVAQRRSGNLEEAQRLFNQVASHDPSHAGLALEQGLIFEAQGNFQRAADAYVSALKNHPKDLDLLLRFGAVQVELGQIADAQQTLEKVVSEIPNSAEAEYFIGRIALAQGRGPEALIHLDRSIALDGTRADFHVYAGFAALEMTNLGRTYQEAQAAMTIDPNLGDPYYLRGLVKLRTGAVKDALEDFEKALRLKPNRYEPYAAIGDCYEQMRNLRMAIASYRKALDKDEKNGFWWYRLGNLQLDLGTKKEAAVSLERATAIGDNSAKTPAWLADSHRLLGDVIASKERKSAINHYQRYLELAAKSSLDRDEVLALLQRWGVEVK
jgi:predicted Zn finger-like uncharacterized protein